LVTAKSPESQNCWIAGGAAMMDERLHTTELPSAARARIERWLTSPGLRDHLQTARDTGRRPSQTGPFIAISREAGTGGTEIARLVAQRLGWDVLDKELLDFMAERYGVPRGMLEFVDESKANWVHDVLSSWFDAKVVSHEKFVVYLERIVFLAAMYGKVVFVGRGAHSILPRSSGLAVRLVAPLEFRIAHQVSQLGVSRKEAQRWIDDTDAGRQEFYRRYFHRDCCNAHDFDLIVNVARFAPEMVVQHIVEAYEHVRRGVANDAATSG
jgi:cytidylate kinase